MKILRIWLVLIAVMCLSTAARAQLAPIPEQRSTALEGSHVFSGLKLVSITVGWHTQAARWLMIFDVATVATIPGDGAVTPVYCVPISLATDAADGFKSFDWTLHPILNSTGVTAVVSTSATGCFNKAVDGSNDNFWAQVLP